MPTITLPKIEYMNILECLKLLCDYMHGNNEYEMLYSE